MIERQPEQEQIYTLSEDEVLAYSRFERIHARMKGMGGSMEGKDHTNWRFYPLTPDVESFSYTSKWARETMNRAERSMVAAVRDSGLNKPDWDNSWQELMRGNVPKAERLDTSEGVCKDGHVMQAKGPYCVCPLDGQITWQKEL